MHRDEELRFVRILHAQVFALDLVDAAAHQSDEDADAMIDVHHQIPGLQVGVGGFWRFDNLAVPLAWLGRRQPKISPSVSRWIAEAPGGRKSSLRSGFPGGIPAGPVGGDSDGRIALSTALPGETSAGRRSLPARRRRPGLPGDR